MAELLGVVSLTGEAEVETLRARLLRAFRAQGLVATQALTTSAACFLRGAPGDGVSASSSPEHVPAVLFGECYARTRDVDPVTPLVLAVEDSGRDALLGRLHLQFGEDVCEALGGAFNLVVPSCGGAAVDLYTSRFGMRPLYYCRTGLLLLFGSKVSLLASALDRAPQWNERYLCEVMLFNCPLGEDTFLEGIETVPPATRVRVLDGRVQSTCYRDPASLVHSSSLDPEDSAQACEAALRQAIERRTAGARRICLSLTGGFDGRTLLSLICPELPLLTYTFGTADSLDVTIAARIADRLSIPHLPILLDGRFLESLAVPCGVEAIRTTEGRSTFKRGHYVHTARILRRAGGVMLTGICGSELLRPIHDAGEMVHPRFRRMLLSSDPIATLCGYLEEADSLFIRREVLARQRDALVASWRHNWIERYEGRALQESVFLFTLRDVFRKYFGPELEMEAPYAVNCFPFLDEDLVATVCRGPFAGYRREAFNDNPVANRFNQEFYARILRRNDRRLYRMPTARGYPPSLILEPLGFFWIAPAYLWRRFIRPHSGDLAMDPLQEAIYQKVPLDGAWEAVDTDLLRRGVAEGKWRQCQLDFSKAYSQAVWFADYHNPSQRQAGPGGAAGELQVERGPSGPRLGR